MKRLIAVLLLAAAATSSGRAQRSLKVLLLYDMEGVSGATDFRHTSFAHPTEYGQGRKSLTADVNAAVAGLKAAGAAAVVVVDGHGSGNASQPDVLEDELVPPAKMHYRDSPFDIYMDSFDESIDAIVAIGMHAGAGNRQGFLSHTYTFEDVEYKVNGTPFNESMILAMGAARLRIPLVTVTGDDQLEKELRRELPWVQYATVKRAVDRSKAEALPREEASRRIEIAAREGLSRLAAAEMPHFKDLYRFELTFQDESQARNAALIRNAELLTNGVSVQFTSRDFEDGYRTSVRLISMASTVGRATAMNAIISGPPADGDLKTAVTDWLYARFLQGLPAPASTQSPQKQRYWGAR